MNKLLAEYIELDLMLDVETVKKIHTEFNRIVLERNLKQVWWWLENNSENGMSQNRKGWIDELTKVVYEENLMARNLNEVCSEVIQNPRLKDRLKYKYA